MLVGAAVEVCSTGGIPVKGNTFTLKFPSFSSTVTAVWIVDIISSSATSVLNLKTTSKIRLLQLKQNIDTQKMLATSFHFPKELFILDSRNRQTISNDLRSAMMLKRLGYWPTWIAMPAIFSKEQSVQNLWSYALPNIMMMVTLLCLPCNYQFDFRVTLSICKDPVNLLKAVETT